MGISKRVYGIRGFTETLHTLQEYSLKFLYKYSWILLIQRSFLSFKAKKVVVGMNLTLQKTPKKTSLSLDRIVRKDICDQQNGIFHIM